MSMLKKFWNDDHAFVTTSDLLILCTILVLGVIVGLTTLRDQVVQELGDLAGAIGEMNQSYSYGSSTIVFAGATLIAAGSEFTDNADDCEPGSTEGSANNDASGSAAACIQLAIPATPEGSNG